ncbi:efflux RND transporter periplasmic adaptor subunit [Aliikangiella maris]|uniref:Efflux RND transporter periplasmic adaptor subunit n=2 Tax=Aliikangiella maris TaxID=3162458 RepID=A0ABV3MSW7_9GAMM
MSKIADTSGQDVIIQPRGRSTGFWVGLGCIVFAVSFCFWLLLPKVMRWSQAEISVPLDRIRIAQVTRGDFVRDVSVQGRIVAAVSPKLYSPAVGTITFLVEAGDEVKQGQQLAMVESPELANQLKQESATLQSLKFERDRNQIQAKKQRLENQKIIDLATVTLNAAKREMRRASDAFQKTAISRLDLEKAQDDLQNAEFAYQHAVKDAALNKESLEFELRTKQLEVERQTLLVDELQRQVNELTMTSPVNGIVGNLDVEQKSSVNKNQPILSVVDLSRYEVELEIPETYADDLTIGMDAEIKLTNQVYAAKLASISPEIQNNQVTGRVRFSQQIPPGLRQNQRLTTRILLDFKSDVLMVRRGQFLESGSGKVAYLVKDGMAARIPIEVGARSLSNVEVLEGLAQGDTIIISSTEQFNGVNNVLLTN